MGQRLFRSWIFLRIALRFYISSRFFCSLENWYFLIPLYPQKHYRFIFKIHEFLFWSIWRLFISKWRLKKYLKVHGWARLDVCLFSTLHGIVILTCNAFHYISIFLPKCNSSDSQTMFCVTILCRYLRIEALFKKNLCGNEFGRSIYGVNLFHRIF